MRVDAVDQSEDGEDDGVNDEFTIQVDTAAFVSAYSDHLETFIVTETGDQLVTETQTYIVT